MQRRRLVRFDRFAWASSRLMGRAATSLAAGTVRRSTRSRRRACIYAALALGAAMIAPSAANAATLERPSAVSPELLTTMSVRLTGLVDPSAPGPAGEYWFVYKRDESQECKGGTSTPHRAYEGTVAEERAEEPELMGLSPYAEYAVCLVVEAKVGAKTEKAEGPVTTFRTPQALEVPGVNPPEHVTARSATLAATLRPGATKSGEGDRYYFNIAESETECEGGSGSKETPEEKAGGTEPNGGKAHEKVSKAVAGLNPDTYYTYCVFVKNDGEAEPKLASAPETFKTPFGEPVIAEQSTVTTGSTGARVATAIGTGALASTYFLEVTSQAQYEAHGWSEALRFPSVSAELPAAKAPVSASVELTELSPKTKYRFRFVATNELGTTVGAEGTLTTAPETAQSLPDDRAYELVSIAGSGEPYYPPSPVHQEQTYAPGLLAGSPFRVSTNGDGIAYVGEVVGSVGAGDVGTEKGNQWLAERGSTGWHTEDITPAENEQAAYEAFASDLSLAYFGGDPHPLAQGVPSGCLALYQREAATGVFTSVTSGAELPSECGHPLFAGATPSGEATIFQTEAALTPGSEEATLADLPSGRTSHGAGGGDGGEQCTFGCNLYESRRGALEAVNVVEGQPVPNATLGGYATGESELPDFSNAISANGEDVFWTDTQTETVYARENGAKTVKVSGSNPAEYWTATPDGRDVFYTEGGALVQFDSVSEAHTELVDAAAEVLGVIGTNQTGEDGGYVYFVANGVLPSAANAQGESATPGNCSSSFAAESHCNLYLLRNSESASPTVEFVAELSGADDALPASRVGSSNVGGDWRPDLGERIAEITPNGETLAFSSIEALTGYHGSSSEVFAYSAGNGELDCVSCSPAGAPPQRLSSPQQEEESGAARVPVTSPYRTYMDTWISDNGAKVFFESSQPLVPQDTNTVQDVYEWERPATPGETSNSCVDTHASPVTGGCTALISGGKGSVDSFLVGADLEGENVFFESNGPLGQLSAPAGDTELYDARIGGGFRPVTAGCTEANCTPEQPLPAGGAPPASNTFSAGPAGNFPPAPHSSPPRHKTRLEQALVACRRDRKAAVRRRCEHAARKRFGTGKASRRAGRAGSSGRRGGSQR
jgi:hypothetical protein